METYQLEGTPREELGKKAVKAIRNAGGIPAVLYGNHPISLPYEGTLAKGEKLVEIDDNKGIIVTDFTVTQEAVRNLIYTPKTHLVELSLKGSKKVMAMVKEIQFQPVKDTVMHIDFMEIFEDRPIIIEVPVKLTGHSEGVKSGGKLSLEMRKLKVKALYKDIPQYLTIDVTKLELGKTIQVGSLHFDKLELVNSKNAVVCAVKLTRAARGAQSTDVDADTDASTDAPATEKDEAATTSEHHQ